jgi:hypothetical protein
VTDTVDQRATSRRSLLTAAAGAAAGAAAMIAAGAAAPSVALADDPNDVVKSVINDVTAVTGVQQTTTDADGWFASGDGAGYGVYGKTSGTLKAGVIGQAGDTTSSPFDTNAFDLEAGVFGYSGSTTGFGSGVYAEGTYGVWGYGDVGVRAEGTSVGLFADARPQGTAVHAHAGDGMAPSPMTSVALLGTVTSNTQAGIYARGRVIFPNRSGKVTFAAGVAKKSVSVSGMTSGNYAFAVLNSTRTGIYVRAVVPAAGKITIYLNKAPSSSTSVAWLVLG